VRKSLSSSLSGMDQPLRAADVAAALNTSLELPDVIGCLNPLCDNKCAWPTGRGRPRNYCSRGCRQSALRMHSRLVGELSLIERLLTLADLRKTDRVRLEARAAQTRWCLRRYTPQQLASRTRASMAEQSSKGHRHIRSDKHG